MDINGSEDYAKREYAHVLLFDKHFDEALDCPLLRNGDFERLSAAYWAVRAFFVFEGVGMYTLCTDEHEVVVQECC